MLSSLMAKVEGAEQPLAESVNEGVSEAGKEVVVSEGEESRQWAELKWSRRADESGAVKSQCRQRQHAWTRLQRGEGSELIIHKQINFN